MTSCFPIISILSSPPPTPPLPLDVTVHLGFPGPYTDLYLGTPFGVAVWSPNPLPLSFNQAHPPSHLEPPKSPSINTAQISPLLSPSSHAPSGVFTTGSSSVCSPLSGAARMHSQITPSQGHAVAVMPGLSILVPARCTVPRTPPYSLFPIAVWI